MEWAEQPHQAKQPEWNEGGIVWVGVGWFGLLNCCGLWPACRQCSATKKATQHQTNNAEWTQRENLFLICVNGANEIHEINCFSFLFAGGYGRWHRQWLRQEEKTKEKQLMNEWSWKKGKGAQLLSPTAVNEFNEMLMKLNEFMRRRKKESNQRSTKQPVLRGKPIHLIFVLLARHAPSKTKKRDEMEEGAAQLISSTININQLSSFNSNKKVCLIEKRIELISWFVEGNDIITVNRLHRN